MSKASVRAPKQKRSRESLERVIAAAIELLEENGFETFTIQDVSRRANVSIGAIYARFGNKESLLRTVHRHAMEALLSEQQESFAAVDGRDGTPARDVVVGAVRTVADVFRTNEKLLGAFMHLGAADDEMARRGSEASIDLARRFALTVLGHRHEITHADPERAVDVVYRMTYCTFARRVMYGPTFESDRFIEWDDLVEEVGVACAAYLLERQPSPRRTRRAA